jgi:hypothetical protein
VVSSETAELMKKLQLKAGGRLLVVGAPAKFKAVLDPIAAPAGEPCEGALVFCEGASDVDAWAAKAIAAAPEDGLLWFAYRKGEAGMAAGIGRDIGWEVLTRLGYRGVRMVSLDDEWSAKRCRETAKVKAG